MEAHHAIEPSTTYLFTAVLVGMVLTLALEEKIHAKKSLITGTYAVIALGLGIWFHVIPGEADVTVMGETLKIPVYISGVDWGVIAIILGSSIFVDVTSKSGLFTFIAIKLTKASRGDPFVLLVYYGIMTVVFSAVLNNVTAMIIVGSLTAVSLKKLERNDKLLGFLLIEGLLTNIGGLLTLISSVPNIIVGQAAGISFVDFFIKAAPFVVVATAVTLFMGARFFQIPRLKHEDEKAKAREQVEGFDERDGIESDAFFNFGAVMLLLFIIALASTSTFEVPVLSALGMGFVAMTFGVIMLLRFKSSVDTFYAKLDWDLLAFFAALFAVINVMEHAQVLSLIGEGLKPITEMSPKMGGGLLLVASAGFSSVTDNIPLAAMLAKILHGLGTQTDSGLWWSVIFGANLGGNLTPIGSASTVVAVTIMHKHQLKMGFAKFVVTALPYAAVQIFLAVCYVLLFLV
jgi:Na+/H+ antiporter NhaD/arsenite permease-like protein